MSNRDLPKASFNVRGDLRTVITPKALERWRPEVKAADSGEDPATISILDVIGQDWMGNGVTASRISAILRNIGKRDVVVNINSPGGDYFEGLAIYNLLRDHPAKVTVKILGVAASAASVIAMAGDEVQIARAGFLMIHNTWIVAMGDRNALREAADWLEPFDQVAVDIYAARTGLEPKAIAKMLDRETWIGGTEAVDKNFADGFLPADAVTETAKQAAGQALKAEFRIDEILARAGVPRSERRNLVAAMKGGTRDAAATDTPSAVVDQVHDLLQRMKAI
ncbi:Clp protease ClpP [Bradyrhizobium sp. 147]|uniref:head maturation protease, ClpP-related n=1 Tax=Bradyrhizobium sp. 147 TaxID=2782623 RepID=UPI001FF8000F|nr:head maturation protease, ClpP-related [Bradyrhizobium sp. 147]MCK1684258.1 Clp protease ClpP [Bradyrhizobium sp. 147]